MRFVHIDESEVEDFNRALAEARRAPDDFSLSEEADDPGIEEMLGVFTPRATVTVTCKTSRLSRTYGQYATAWLLSFENDLLAGVFDRKSVRNQWEMTCVMVEALVILDDRRTGSCQPTLCSR